VRAAAGRQLWCWRWEVGVSQGRKLKLGIVHRSTQVQIPKIPQNKTHTDTHIQKINLYTNPYILYIYVTSTAATRMSGPTSHVPRPRCPPAPTYPHLQLHPNNTRTPSPSPLPLNLETEVGDTHIYYYIIRESAPRERVWIYIYIHMHRGGMLYI